MRREFQVDPCTDRELLISCLAGWEADGALPALETLDVSLNSGLNGFLPAFGSTTAAPRLQWLALQGCNFTGMAGILD